MDLAGATIAVTGATGFLGRYISEELIARGVRVVGVVRDPSRAPDLAAQGVEFRVADLLDREALARAFEGVDAIVANAGVTLQRIATDYYEINTGGTENVFRAAQEAGVRRIVQVSSVAVYRRPFRNETEDGDLARRWARFLPTAGYRLSKAQAETLAGRISEEAGLQLTIVRPGQMFGVQDPFLSGLRRFLGGARHGMAAWLSTAASLCQGCGLGDRPDASRRQCDRRGVQPDRASVLFPGSRSGVALRRWPGGSPGDPDSVSVQIRLEQRARHP